MAAAERTHAVSKRALTVSSAAESILASEHHGYQEVTVTFSSKHSHNNKQSQRKVWRMKSNVKNAFCSWVYNVSYSLPSVLTVPLVLCYKGMEKVLPRYRLNMLP